MAIFANGPGTQSYTVAGTAATQIFNTANTALSGVLKNLTVINTGTVTAYIGGSGLGTASTTSGVTLAAGNQLLLEGPAINLYAIAASATTQITTALATQSVVD